MISLLRIACLAGVVLLAACSKPQLSDTAAPTPVRVVHPVPGPAAPPVTSTGVITASDEQTLSFKLGGVLKAVHVQAGQVIHAGQVLAELQPPETDAALIQAQQMNDKAARDAQRGQRLYDDQVISLEQWQNLQTQARMAAAQLSAARFNQGTARITAAAAGVVLRKLAQANETVAPGQPILVVGDSNQGFILKAGLADRELVLLKRGDVADIHIDALPDTTLSGRINVIGGAAARENGLFPIEIQLDHTTAPLVPGLVASFTVQPATHQAPLLYIPAGAIVAGVDNQAHVFVMGNGKAIKRQVEVAFFAREQVAIRSGLTADDQLITDGALYLSDGEAVGVQAE